MVQSGVARPLLCRALIAYNEIDEETDKHPSLRAQRRLLSANLTAQNSC